MTRTQISGRLLARNSALNLIGQVVPLLVGVIAMPLIVRGLGAERFGLLSLAWVILGYFALFDLGLGRATTKYVAEAMSRGDEDQVPRLAWTALVVQGTLGVVGVAVFLALVPLLTVHMFRISSDLVGEARAALSILALAIPIILASGSFSGVLEAAQRFDLVNAVKIPANASTYLLPPLGMLLGLSLPGIMGLIVVARLISLAALALVALHVYPGLHRPAASLALLPRLFSYGGWITVTSIVNPILMYLDRLLVASLLSVAALGYYAAPYEAVTRLWVIPASLAMSLFPAFSALDGQGDRTRMGDLFLHGLKYTLLAVGPIVLALALFASELLAGWLGPGFAAQAAGPVRILAVGALINALALTPSTLLQGLGRPDLTAKFHLLELPLHVGLTWLLVTRLGLVGAAIAWSARVTLDAVLLFAAARQAGQLSPGRNAVRGLQAASLASAVLAGVAYGVRTMAGALPVLAQAGLLALAFGVFGGYIWRSVLDSAERDALVRMAGARRGQEGST